MWWKARNTCCERLRPVNCRSHDASVTIVPSNIRVVDQKQDVRWLNKWNFESWTRQFVAIGSRVLVLKAEAVSRLYLLADNWGMIAASPTRSSSWVPWSESLRDLVWSLCFYRLTNMASTWRKLQFMLSITGSINPSLGSGQERSNWKTLRPTWRVSLPRLVVELFV